VDNILVTGGAGYIGSHACKALKNRGVNPVTFDSLITGWKDSVKFGPFVKGDLLDPRSIEQVFSEWKPKAVMHFAALSEVATSVNTPELYWRNNVLGSLNLLEAMLKANCHHLVFSSTCSIYGENDSVMVNEDSPTNPLNPYAASKRAVEDMISGIVAATELKVIRFRYFNVSGADPEGQIGEFHRPETSLIPLVLENIKAVSGQIEIFGDDYPTADGTCIRDYIHVEDLVHAHILGLNALFAGSKKDEVYNLGNGNGFSVKEVINCCLRVTNKQVPVIIKSRRAGDASAIVSGSEKAKLELGWRCQYPEIDNIVSHTWNWIKHGAYQK